MQLGEASSPWTQALSPLSVTDLRKLRAICVGSIVRMLLLHLAAEAEGGVLPGKGGEICTSE